MAVNFIREVSMCWVTLLFYKWKDPDLPSIPFNVCLILIFYILKRKKNQFFTLLKNTGISEKMKICKKQNLFSLEQVNSKASKSLFLLKNLKKYMGIPLWQWAKYLALSLQQPAATCSDSGLIPEFGYFHIATDMAQKNKKRKCTHTE